MAALLRTAAVEVTVMARHSRDEDALGVQVDRLDL